MHGKFAPQAQKYGTLRLIFKGEWQLPGIISYIATSNEARRIPEGKMARKFTPKVLTANDLRLGDVVYMTTAGTWTRCHTEAELLEEEADAELRLLKAQGQAHIVVGPYLADAKAGPNGPEPVHFREAFRTRGPSNYFHGKQETSKQEPTHV
jgi:hypothetical protein